MDADAFSQVLLAILIIVITIVLLLLYKRTKSVRRAILLTGLCDTGKTLLFARLVHKKFINTQTSIKENIGEYTSNAGTVRLIDIPGHERLRNKFFDQFKPSTRAIIYVLDSVTIQRDIRDVAEYLYNIITDNLIAGNATPLLIACNKQDLPLAKGMNAIKSILEKELNTLRITKSSQLESVDPKSKKNSFLGDDRKEFDFSQLNVKIEFCEVNATGVDDRNTMQIDALTKWLLKVS